MSGVVQSIQSAVTLTAVTRSLADNDVVVVDELVLRYLQIQRCGTDADTSGSVVVGSVARAEPALPIARIRDRYAAQMRADADQNQPLRLFHSHCIGLWIFHKNIIIGPGRFNLTLGSISYKHGLAAPFDSDSSSVVNFSQIDLQLGRCHDIG